MTDHTQLRKLAEAATPGPWWSNRTNLLIVNDGKGSSEWLVATVAMNTYKDQGRYNSQFIAAANPQAVIELLDEIERLRKDAEPSNAEVKGDTQ